MNASPKKQVFLKPVQPLTLTSTDFNPNNQDWFQSKSLTYFTFGKNPGMRLSLWLRSRLGRVQSWNIAYEHIHQFPEIRSTFIYTLKERFINSTYETLPFMFSSKTEKMWKKSSSFNGNLKFSMAALKSVTDTKPWPCMSIFLKDLLRAFQSEIICNKKIPII